MGTDWASSTGKVGTAVEQEKLVTVIDLERAFGLPRSWWYNQAEAGLMPSFRLGKYRKFRLSEVVTWLEQHRSGPAQVASNGTPLPDPAPTAPAAPRPVPRKKERRARSTRR
jgi:hypothetical protein